MTGTLKESLFGESHKTVNRALGIDYRRTSEVVRPETCSECVHRFHPERCMGCKKR